MGGIKCLTGLALLFDPRWQIGVSLIEYDRLELVALGSSDELFGVLDDDFLLLQTRSSAELSGIAHNEIFIEANISQ